MIPASELDRLGETLATAGFGEWSRALAESAAHAGQHLRHGDLPRWQAALDALPPARPATPVRLDTATITAGDESEDALGGRLARHAAASGHARTAQAGEQGRPGAEAGAAAGTRPGAGTSIDRQALEQALRALSPWRKGPFRLHGVTVDAEWRSDLKWARLSPALAPLDGRRLLDVGAGNGYYALRALGAGARLVVGIDPTPLYVFQYLAVSRYLGSPAAWVLPLALEALPGACPGFDTVLSMGVLYHRRSPLDHLTLLGKYLRPGGELVIETLVVEGDEHTAMVPAGRYARMRNVWFVPSVQALEVWLARAGYRHIRCIDISRTTEREQRNTDWMPHQSLSAALSRHDPRLTVEGLPAPLRARRDSRDPPHPTIPAISPCI